MKNKFRSNLTYLKEINNESFASIGLQADCSANTVSYWINKKSEPKMNEVEKIAQYFEISIQDLLYKDLSIVHLNKKESEEITGENVHLNVHPSVHLNSEKGKKPTKLDTDSTNRMPKVITMDSAGKENVIMVPVKARAGYLNGYADPQFINTLPAYRLPGLNHGTYRIFEVEGSSMYPTLNGGDLVICSFVENLMSVRDDRLYVVVTKTDGIVVKRCLNRFEKDGKLILKSDNYKDRDLYPTIVCHQEDIVEIWYATSFISYQMRPPSEMYNRLIDLEGRLTLLEHLNKK